MASELYLCYGTLSKIPYFLSGLGVNIYSFDELCFYICQNAYILDNDLFDLKLCDYIRDNLELPQLADYIRDMIREKKPLGEIVTSILNITGYCNEEEIHRIRQILVDNASLSFAAKRKVRGDNLLTAGKYTRALEEYQYVLAGLDRNEEPDLYSSILHNMGCAYSQMFLLDKAADLFKKAYDVDGDRESLILYLVALRLTVSKEDFDHIVVKNSYDERVTLEALRRMSAAKEAEPDTEYAKQYKDLTELREAGKVSEYYSLTEKILENWKFDYRHSME